MNDQHGSEVNIHVFPIAPINGVEAVPSTTPDGPPASPPPSLADRRRQLISRILLLIFIGIMIWRWISSTQTDLTKWDRLIHEIDRQLEDLASYPAINSTLVPNTWQVWIFYPLHLES